MISVQSQLIEKRFLILFIGITLFYVLFYGPYGYDDADGGYTLALSWRLYNGELPYKDFIIVRPPLSPIFHSLFFYIIPDNFQLIFDRTLCYVLFALSSLFGALTIKLKFPEIEIDVYLLASIGFVFSIVNFPPMAWHTLDGIFFASIGVYILTKYSSVLSIPLGILFLFLSALCKQPFYLLPVAALSYIALLTRDVKRVIIAATSLMLLVGCFYYTLHALNILDGFIAQTTGSTTITDLLIACGNYLSVNSFYFLLPIIFWVMFRTPFTVLGLTFDKKWVPFIFISLLLILPMLLYLKALFFTNDSKLQVYRANTTAIMLFIVTILLILANIVNSSKWITLVFLILISWCASISWSYQTPVLFSVPLVFGFFVTAQKYFELKKVTNLAFFTLTVAFATYLIAYQKPYGNPMRNELNYSVGNIFSKLYFIKVGKETHEKYSEFSQLVQRYGNNFKTLPGMPLSNFLTNSKSPIKLDWVFNAEAQNENQNIISQLKNKKTTIFIEKAPQLISVSPGGGKFISTVTYEIKMTWNKIDSTKYFEIYTSF